MMGDEMIGGVECWRVTTPRERTMTRDFNDLRALTETARAAIRNSFAHADGPVAEAARDLVTVLDGVGAWCVDMLHNEQDYPEDVYAATIRLAEVYGVKLRPRPESPMRDLAHRMQLERGFNETAHLKED